MKNLSISLALILTLLTGQSALAELSETPSNPASGIDTIVVVAASEVAHFEIFSEKHSERTMDQMINFVITSLDRDNAEKVNQTSEI